VRYTATEAEAQGFLDQQRQASAAG
jgi:hypothetical protein